LKSSTDVVSNEGTFTTTAARPAGRTRIDSIPATVLAAAFDGVVRVGLLPPPLFSIVLGLGGGRRAVKFLAFGSCSDYVDFC
jgi:hypothetical protein